MSNELTRRDFIITTTSAVSANAIFQSAAHASSSNAPRPNILWITSEDNGPHLGAYGDKFADTPNIDGIAENGTIYLNAWSTAPVCAPARTTIISGVYPPCTGSEHMRSMLRLPDRIEMFPLYLREIGYYCTNNRKEDYNLEKTGEVWDESSGDAHWRNRKSGQPFFAVFNYTTTHESQIRKRPHTPVHDPDKVPIPAYHPDTPEVRRDWAQYYDKMTEMDRQVGGLLKQLKEDGLEDNTIIFYYGDHGPGMPRSKRWPYNSGLRVPMVVHIPDKFKHLAPPDYRPGGQSDRIVGFIDLAPTVLSLAGIKPPTHMQGHAFLGDFHAEQPEFGYGFRGRMDERYDMVRTVRDKRYIYIRNYMPHRIYGQYLNYMFQTPTTQVWKRLYDQGELEPPKTYFWETKPAEELYDLENDPDEVNNLAHSPEHQGVIERLRAAHKEWELSIRDVGFLPEGEIHSRSEGSTAYEMGRDRKRYPLKRIMGMADLAASLDPGVVAELVTGLNDKDSAVRYWAAMGLLMRGEQTVREQRSVLMDALEDPSPYVRIMAAEALGRYSDGNDVDKALKTLLDLASLEKNSVYVSMYALNSLDKLGQKAKPALDAIEALPLQDPSVHGRMRNYVTRLVERITSNLKG